LERTSKETGWKPPKIEDDSGEQSKPRRNTTQKSQGNQRRKPNPRELTSPSGHKVLVGRNRRDNEAICFALSKPTDIWMHARGCPGAHVLLCVRRGSPEVTDEDLQFAADLAAFYSDARTERRAEITTAEPKHITKPRGAPPGAVTLRQEGKTLLGKPEDVAEELKEARELSGANWSELGYRKLGKRANNKKKTAAVEKETAKKRREEARENNKRRKRKEETDWF
jgi:predicted ribosome quality control (RQC) complex YloA/Tae2 family protein